ncbi:uncharacterized protein MONBRDRAFT_27661 [Monosiga brevicollis MX1]|uniref:THH1/TOM1/TOM3 domain-containing protein n=1 Tax=Monosiga brevicollis TaxID=81824 RepID=A9V5Y5_MONBE|nr:uncharacterized protein MONBRDRAFT_27661 [Monosiga brevicollis MX1]EDQ87191.1 predicted protein [Monosiga brevicollis MX1]|eukprot:XP_001748134.1 hypothetical protein [Monosiga brevicollis MX1]
MSLLGLTTFILCSIKVRARLLLETQQADCASHRSQHSLRCSFHPIALQLYRILRGYCIEKYHLAVFMLAWLESLLLFLHWFYLRRVEIHFVCLYLQVNQYLCISLFYSSLALKITEAPHLWNKVVVPVGSLLFAYFSGALIYSLVSIVANSAECKQPPWLLFSTSKLLLAQFFAISARKLIQTIEAANTDVDYKRLKQRVVWSLVWGFEISAIADFTVDLVYNLGSRNTGCDQVFGQPNTAQYTAVSITLRLLTNLIPIWVMLYQLRPAARSVSPARAAGLHDADVEEPRTFTSAPAFVFDDFVFDLPEDDDELSRRLLDDTYDSINTP